MRRARISVIIPVHNAEQYIQRCITSVLNQTVSDFELVVSDDASTDNTHELIKQFVFVN